MIVKKETNIDIVTAARQRIINVFSNGCKVYMSFSGGKDSICLGHLVYSLIQEGKIDPSLLTVQFVDIIKGRSGCLYTSSKRRPISVYSIGSPPLIVTC